MGQQNLGKDYTKITNTLILVLTIITVLLFLSSYANNLNLLKLSTQIFGILYLFGFIIFMLLRKKRKTIIKTQTKIIEKPILIKEGKRQTTKKYTGSIYGKIYHRRECRFSESIMDKYFEENDNKNYFKNKEYKPCGLCKPNKIIKIKDSNIKEDKK